MYNVQRRLQLTMPRDNSQQRDPPRDQSYSMAALQITDGQGREFASGMHARMQADNRTHRHSRQRSECRGTPVNIRPPKRQLCLPRLGAADNRIGAPLCVATVAPCCDGAAGPMPVCCCPSCGRARGCMTACSASNCATASALELSRGSVELRGAQENVPQYHNDAGFRTRRRLRCVCRQVLSGICLCTHPVLLATSYVGVSCHWKF